MSLWTTQSIRGTLELPKQGPLSVLSSGWHWWQVHTGCLNLKWMALRGRRINNYLELGDLLIWVSLISFQKTNISWPQQPPTEKVLKFKMISHDSNPKFIGSKHQNKAEFNNLDDYEVLSSDFSGLRTSAASLSSSASATSLTSTASIALYHQGTSWTRLLDHP